MERDEGAPAAAPTRQKTVMRMRRAPDGESVSRPILSMVEALKLLKDRGIDVKRDMTPRFLIDPRTSTWIAYWNGCAIVALLFVAVATPYEVSFLNAGGPDTMFYLNRVVDIIFATDITVQFFLMYQDSEGWVKNHRQIVHRYLRGWFTIDFFSTAISAVDIYSALLIASAEAEAVATGMTSGSNQGASRFAILRMFRVLRLVKLARLARASRVLQHWQMKLNLSYATVAIIKCVLGVVLTMHWSACTWALQVSFTNKPLTGTWYGDDSYCVKAASLSGPSPTYTTDGPTTLAPADDAYLCVPPLDMYAAATYFAVMTITSIGYGDISATAQNPLEQTFATILMLVGGLMWGYVIGTFAGLFATSAPVMSARPYRTAYTATARRARSRVAGPAPAASWARPTIYIVTVSRQALCY